MELKIDFDAPDFLVVYTKSCSIDVSQLAYRDHKFRATSR